jgi:hypothetical protein
MMMMSRQGRALERMLADANHGQLLSEDLLPC